MWPDLAVIANDIVRHILFSFDKTLLSLGWHPFRFKLLKNRSIGALSQQFPQPLTVFEAGVMAALVRVEHQVFRLTSRLKSHFQLFTVKLLPDVHDIAQSTGFIDKKSSTTAR